MPQPSPDDINAVSAIISAVKDWAGVLFGGAGVTAVAYFFNRIAKFEHAMSEVEKVAMEAREHELRIKSLESNFAEKSVQIAALPTRLEFDTAIGLMRNEMNLGFANLTRLIIGPRD